MTSGDFDTILAIGAESCSDARFMEFHINGKIRKECDFDETLFASSGNVIFTSLKSIRLFIQKYNKIIDGTNHPEQYLKAGQLNAMGLIDEIFHYVCRLYRSERNTEFFTGAAKAIIEKTDEKSFNELLSVFTAEFPPMAVYRGKTDPETWLAGMSAEGIPNRIIALEELMMLRLANENPAFEPFFPLFNDKKILKKPAYLQAWDALRSWSTLNPPFGPEGLDLISMLKAPVEFSPYDLKGQLDYIRTHWTSILGEWLSRLLSGLDLIAEEEKSGWAGGIGSGTPEMPAYEFGDISKEYERFTPDRDWMPNVILMAKSILVWLSQLSEKYQRPITRLDQIPDEELDFLSQAGFTGLWLIGLWERSPASARIKQICGNPEAAASAYSLDDYEIAQELGGWQALDNLRARAWKRGIKMASDMVPNHTGLDASWVVEKPDLFVQTRECPFPGYDFNGENLSHDSRVGIYLENHYYAKSDCAVVFKRVDNHSGDIRYIYHGNDGTGMPWNDTAQIDFLNPAAREEVIQKILHVARNFPIIRFDAAMVLAKKHIQRLWYPEPGKGGDIASRSQHALTRDEFELRIPEEFWREVVDRCAKEIPDTLLLAEAFWMMEGYFVRTLGMHRVYNSAFMNMLKREDNEKYRTTIKNTIEFDPEILKRYVNFMNNPDEETAVAQFGRGDKYFGVCTMMVAMPGLPMFGHGQIEGFEEKYGMEYRKAYRNEQVDEDLVNRHRREIFPLMKKRWLFAGVENFHLYDFWENGNVNENVFVWSNRAGSERALIFYNNAYQQTSGWVKMSAASTEKREDGSKQLVQRSVAEGLGLAVRDNRFCIMQEQRTGLWYLRTTAEIATSGLYAALAGFQTQVFINIHEVDDNEQGHYRALYKTLNGRGITDVHMGIQNIFLKELYASLEALASPEYFREICAIPVPAEKETKAKTTSALRSDKTTSAEETVRIETFIASLEKPARAFFVTCNLFIAGNYGAQTISGIAKRTEAPEENTLWNLFAGDLEKLFAIKSCGKKLQASLSKESALLLETVRTEFAADPALYKTYGALLILLAVCSLAGTNAKAGRRLIDLWNLDRKIADLLTDYGMDGAEILPRIQELSELLALVETETAEPDQEKAELVTKKATGKADKPATEKQSDATPPDPKAARSHPAAISPEGSLVSSIFTSEYIQKLAGVHEWDGIRWFNKEKAEELLELLTAGLVLAGLPAEPSGKKNAKKKAFSQLEWSEELSSIAALHKKSVTVLADSGYRLDTLLDGTLLKKKAEKPAKTADEHAKVKPLIDKKK